MAVTYLSTSAIIALTDDDNTLSGSVTVNASADYAEAKISWGHYATAPAISSVTLGGNAMTAVAANTGGAIGGVADARNQTFRLISPPTGSQTLLVTFASQTYAQSGDVESYSGVDQTTPTEGHNSATGTSASPLVAPTTTTASGNLISGSVITGNTSAANISCDYTETSEVDFTAVANVVSAYGYRATTGSGQNIEWSQSSVLWYAQCHVIRAAASATNYTLTADAGSYAVSGQAATFNYSAGATSYTLTADAGAYVLSGQAATLTYVAGSEAFTLTCDAGSYALAGQDASFTYVAGAENFTLTADAGSYTLNGQAATFVTSFGATAYSITADAGAYSLSGQDAAFTYVAGATNYTLTCDAGSYNIAGQDATLDYVSNSPNVYTLACDAGAYLVEGQEATFNFSGVAANDGFGGFVSGSFRDGKRVEF